MAIHSSDGELEAGLKNDAGPASTGKPEVQNSNSGRPLSASEVVADMRGDRTTQRGLKSRHAQMIAVGGSIGTG
jgi:amino acid permease